jgi:chromosome partitioning protein
LKKIIVIGSTKGGSGKTTLCIHLAAHHESLGGQVLLVDADPTQASSMWCKKRNSKNIDVLHYASDIDLTQQLALLKDQHSEKLIIVDCGGFDSRSMRTSMAADSVDLVVIASKCSAIDLAVSRPFIIQTVKELKYKKTVLRACLSEVDSRPNMAGKILAAKDVFSQFGLTTLDHFVYRREAYKDYFLRGGDALANDVKAKRDIDDIYNEIREVLIYD